MKAIRKLDLLSALTNISNIVGLADEGRLTETEAISSVKHVLESLAPKEEEKELLQ